ncbi:hypothetical protein H477_5177 [[Clostridium] sordellii ATCC 9714]|nr:hypothetical protein H477_5177 [[Clostridium] sordellii ATCC 9714] [Paeniclostridium sordellii ATCC 9714]
MILIYILEDILTGSNKYVYLVPSTGFIIHGLTFVVNSINISSLSITFNASKKYLELKAISK